MFTDDSGGELRIGLGARAFLFALFYAAAAWLGYLLSTQVVAATFWPPAGLFVAVLLLTRPAERPVFLAAGIIANLCADLSFGRPLTLALGFALANAAMALIATVLIRRFGGDKSSLDSARSVWLLIVFAAEDILPQAKVLMVADVVEAMTSDRPYRAALGIDAALAEVELGCGTRYDANVTRACIECFRKDGFAFSNN